MTSRPTFTSVGASVLSVVEKEGPRGARLRRQQPQRTAHARRTHLRSRLRRLPLHNLETHGAEALQNKREAHEKRRDTAIVALKTFDGILKQ